MSFNWKAFATGFMERTTDILQERKTEAKEYEKEQKASAERNAAVISRRRAIADQVTGYANFLKENGVSNAQLQATIATGPKAIESLTERVRAAVASNNGKPLAESDVSTLISMPEGFTPVDMTTKEFIDTTYGLRTREQKAATTAEQEDYNLMDKLFGKNLMPQAEQRIQEAPFMEGLSVAEVNRLASQADYQSLVPGTFANIIESSGYDATEEGLDFATAFETRLNRLQSSDEYKLALGDDKGTPGENVRALLEERLGPMIDGFVNRYGESFIADQGSYLESIMGEDYMAGLIKVDEEEKPTVKPTSAPVTPTPAEPASTTAEPIVAATPTESATPTVTNAPAVRPEGEEDTTAEVIADGVPATVKPETIPEPDANATVRSKTEDGEEITVTYAEWTNMSRQQRKRAGLPVSWIGGQLHFNRFLAGIGMADPETGEVGFQSKEEVEREVVQPSPTYTALSEQGVDDISISLLQQRGSDMLAYVQEKGAKSEEEIMMALVEYGQDNNIVMPFDKSAMIYAFKTVIDGQDKQ